MQYKPNRDAVGNPRSLGGVQMRMKDLYKIAQLVMNKGIWKGERLLTEGWIDRMLTSSEESRHKCGLLWWVYQDPLIYAAQGHLGQWLYILPEKKIIALRQMRSGKRPLDQVDEYKDFRELVKQL